MPRSFMALTLGSLLFVVGGIWAAWGNFQGYALPFTLRVTDASTAVVEPNAGMPMPAGIEPGDRVDLSSLDPATRAAVAIFDWDGNLPGDVHYTFILQRGGLRSVVSVTPVPATQGAHALWTRWIFLALFLTIPSMGLLVLWRGRDRAASYMTAWLGCFAIAFGLNYGFRVDGAVGVIFAASAFCFYGLARVGLYLMIESLVGDTLGPVARLLFRAAIALIVLTGIGVWVGGHVAYVLTGWAGLMRPDVGILFTAGYFVSALLLIYGYGHAASDRKPHMRWMLASLVVFLTGVFISNTRILDVITSEAVQTALIVAGITGFAYTALRHRVVDVRVVLDRTLVYGATTALVVGVVATMNSLALRATLGDNAGFLLQILVPLALGIVLGKVRTALDRIVEQVFFRRKYLAEKALKDFSRQAGHMESVARLLEAAAREIARDVGAPAVALYSAERDGYQLLRHAGNESFPARLDPDDAAFVALRSERFAVELTEFSALGSDGCVFPMMVLGNIRGCVVCRNRPGEHYAVDERTLLTQVAGDVGAAMRILRARDNEAIIIDLVEGKVPVEVLRERARGLGVAWSAS